MKYRYYYNDGKIIDHTKLIENKTIRKEKGNATGVIIYKVHTIYETEERKEYLTTLLLN